MGRLDRGERCFSPVRNWSFETKTSKSLAAPLLGRWGVVNREIAVPLDVPFVEASLTAHAGAHQSGTVGNGTNAGGQTDACRTRWATSLEGGDHDSRLCFGEKRARLPRGWHVAQESPLSLCPSSEESKQSQAGRWLSRTSLQTVGALQMRPGRD